MNTRTYTLEGMTCSSCETKVKNSLEHINQVSSVIPSKDMNQVVINSTGPISLGQLEEALKPFNGKYTVSDQTTVQNSAREEEDKRTWLGTYKPILLIFAYILGTTLLIQFVSGQFNFVQWMRHFMAGFFLVFSFFKMLNLKAFAESYAMYDVIAQRFPSWGFIYAWIELFLGIAYLVNFNPIVTNLTTFVVMSISIIGVIQSVLNQQKIQCACVGTVFDLPMSTVTIIEDGLMIIMSFFMLLNALQV